MLILVLIFKTSVGIMLNSPKYNVNLYSSPIQIITWIYNFTITYHNEAKLDVEKQFVGTLETYFLPLNGNPCIFL